MTAPKSANDVTELIRLSELVRTLRARCPWDRRQTHLSLAPHLLEEAYEALDAVEALSRSELEGREVTASEIAHLQEELGDVLFQVFFHSELAAEKGRFSISDVARSLHDKLVSRHPHVFGEASAETAEDVAARWEVLKRSEKKRRGMTDTIPEAMPALALATKLVKKAESLGMSRPPTSEQVTQVESTVERLAAIARASDVDDSRDTPSSAASPGEAIPAVGEAIPAVGEAIPAVGEALLGLVDLSRRVGVDPEMALRSAAARLRETIERQAEERAG